LALIDSTVLPIFSKTFVFQDAFFQSPFFEYCLPPLFVYLYVHHRFLQTRTTTRRNVGVSSEVQYHNYSNRSIHSVSLEKMKWRLIATFLPVHAYFYEQYTPLHRMKPSYINEEELGQST